MLPLLVAAGLGGLILANQAKKGRGGAVFELDPGLHAEEAHFVIATVKNATSADVPRLDAMAKDYASRGLPFTAQTIALASWNLRGRPGAPPTVMLAGPSQNGAAAPHVNGTNGAPHTNGASPNGAPHVNGHNGHANGQAQAPAGSCLDAQTDPATCAAVTSALGTESNPDKLHAFAESLRMKYPQAASALDARASLLGGAATKVAAPPTAPAPSAPSAAPSNGGGGGNWTPVAPDLSNVPEQYHGPVTDTVLRLSSDPSMALGTEASLPIGDRVFVFTKPQPAQGVAPGSVWCTRMSSNGSAPPPTGTAATGYGSGPLWPVDIVDGRRSYPDRRFVGSPTVYDGGAQAMLSPQAQPMEMIMPGMPAGTPMQPMVVVGGDGLAEQVASTAPGAIFTPSATPEIFGASAPEIVGGIPSEAAAMPPPPFGLSEEAHAEVSDQALAEQAQAEDEVSEQAQPALAPPPMHATGPLLSDRQAPMRLKPSAYVVIRPSDRAWPQTISKIGSGNKRSFDHLVALNPHLVSTSGAWPQLYPGDEVNVPSNWAENLTRKGFEVMADQGVT
jgi:hypothetical protein